MGKWWEHPIFTNSSGNHWSPAHPSQGKAILDYVWLGKEVRWMANLLAFIPGVKEQPLTFASPACYSAVQGWFYFVRPWFSAAWTKLRVAIEFYTACLLLQMKECRGSCMKSTLTFWTRPFVHLSDQSWMHCLHLQYTIHLSWVQGETLCSCCYGDDESLSAC